MASSGMRRTAHAAPTRATAVKTRTRILFRALHSMTRSTIARPSVRLPLRRRSGEGSERGAEARLGVDEEVRRGHDLLAGREARPHLVVSPGLPPELDGPRREASLALDDEDEAMGSGVEDRRLRDGELVPERDLDGGVDERLGAEVCVGCRDEHADACRPRRRIE